MVDLAIFSFLATPLGFVMKWIYALLQNYGWTIILFTILARVLMFPLSLKQQRSTAKTQAYQPMIQEIQKKWANDKNRQNQEMQKFYEENNIKMTAGCAPMLVNMLVIFGMIYAIQAPLNYILQVPEDQITNGITIVQNSDAIATEIDGNNTYTVQSVLIGEIKENPEVFVEGVEALDAEGNKYVAKMDADVVEQVKDFNFEFAGFDLSEAPTWNFNKYLILPILSILTMFASQFIVMKTSPGSQQMGGQMIIMTLVMGVMFGFYAFRVPVGFSLYYTVSNVVMLFQQLLLRKIYNPEKIREEVVAEIEARHAEKKAKKKVKVKDEKGEVVSLDVSEAELNKMRLAKARELDEKRYREEEEAEKVKAEEATEKARKLDEEKYGAAAPKTKASETSDLNETDDAVSTEETASEKSDENLNKTQQTETYKPGRRKRARNKQDKETSFVEKEREAEEYAKRAKEAEES